MAKRPTITKKINKLAIAHANHWLECSLISEVTGLIAGVDEVGRGPLAGPVVTCAVLWPDNHGIAELDDSKKLLKEVKKMVDEAKKSEGFILKQPGK